MPTPQTTAQTDQTPLVELAPPVSSDGPSRSQSPSRRRKVRAVRKLLVRQHTRGHFFVRDQGKDIYLSTNFNEAHAALDAAVLDAYGFSAKKDLLKQLLDLNLAVAKAIDRGEPVSAPGVPPSYGDPADLITEDCIKA